MSAAAVLALSASALAQSDACSSATLIGDGVYSGTTVVATHDGFSGCGSSDLSPDVWYKLVADTAKSLVVTTCGGANWDTVLAIHTGCPATTANAVACNDDAPGCGNQSYVEWTMTPGQTYYIRVSGYGGSTGPFTINVSFQEPPPPPPPPTRGPDVWIEDFTDIAYYDTAGNIAAFAVGTDACNQGDAPAEWQSANNRHPVIAQNLYRLKGGRFEQLGQSWLKHGFASTNSNACGSCQTPPGGGSQLGLACSDAYGAGLNGGQNNLGPRSQVNPATGVFPYPYSAPAFTGNIARRIQVATADVTPSQNAGALYFAECQYITQDDAQWGNGLNNASYRRVNFNTPTTGQPAWSNPVFAAAIVRQQNAIRAWGANDSTVVTNNIDYPEQGITPTSPRITGRFIVASKATNNNNGTWTYEYAVENVNSDRAGGMFSVALPPHAVVSNVGFHSVPTHSGEPFSNTAWTSAVGTYDITWRTQTYAVNPNANALRWGTLYNFRFTADVAPSTGQITLGLFKPAQSATLPSALLGDGVVPDPTVCIGDFNRDGGFDGSDIAAFFSAWQDAVPAADTNSDGGIDGSDIQVFFERWTASSC